MTEQFTREICVQKYQECKLEKNGDVPEIREFLEYAKIPRGQLSRLFGASAYSELQLMAGDMPNKLKLERTPTTTIMERYGTLIEEIGHVPSYPEWDHRGLRPTIEGLRKIHNIPWSGFPKKFVEWMDENRISDFKKARQIISASNQGGAPVPISDDARFSRLIMDVRAWTPARRRNSEEAYKIELRKHLESLKCELNEEFGESKCDLLVWREHAIEVKKDPDLGEYDRLFGQVARHLQHQCKVIVLIMEATRGDKYNNFTSLVDKYFNVSGHSVEIIKK